MTNRFRNVGSGGARSIGSRSAGAFCRLMSASLIASAVTGPSVARARWVSELPPEFSEAAPEGASPLACVARLRSLGSPVEFSVVTSHDDGFDEYHFSGRLFRAGPAHPYSNLAASGHDVTIYLDGFVSVEDLRERSITTFTGECLGDELLGWDGTDVWVFSFGATSPTE